jgi:hypothetical protein
MDDATRMEIEHACGRLTASFAFLIDRRRYEELVMLFTEDCHFERPGASVNGRSELLSFMHRRPLDGGSRHVCAAPVFEDTQSDSARSVTYMTFYEGDTSGENPIKVSGLAEYHDTFKRVKTGWLIHSREVRLAMISKR